MLVFNGNTITTIYRDEEWSDRLNVVTKDGDITSTACCEQANVRVAPDVLFRIRVVTLKDGRSIVIASPLSSTERLVDDEQVVRAWFDRVLAPKLGKNVKFHTHYMVRRKRPWPSKGYSYYKPKVRSTDTA
jgi:hypothetical protein